MTSSGANRNFLPPPEKMEISGDVVANWEHFKDSWNNYIIATKLDKEDKNVIVATLKTIMGKDCYKIFKNLPLTDDETKDHTTIIKKLTEHFQPKRNTIYERYIFHLCTQDATESVDTFINRLREAVATCGYGQLQDEMVRDRIVIGIKSNTIRAKLLGDSELTLEKAITTCRTSEITSKQLKKMDGDNDSVNLIQSNFRKACRYCGEHHKRGQCPAYGKRCDKCSRMNHSSKVCRSRGDANDKSQKQEKKTPDQRSEPGKRKPHKVHLVEDEQYLTDSSVESTNIFNSGSGKKYFIELKIKGKDEYKNIKLQLDTGATCSTMSYKDYKSITNEAPDPSMKVFKLYDNTTIKSMGHTRMKCKTNSKRIYIHFEIIKENDTSLLSGSAAEALGLIKFDENIFQLKAINLTKEQVIKEYKDVFTGLGKMPGFYHIEMDNNTKPVQDHPRRVPILLKEELKKKLEEMERNNIIKKVSEPTPWISSLVVVKKPNKIRVCLDPQNLNKGIKRNNYPTPTIDDISPDLAKAKVFSVVDAKDGFLQVALDEPSSYLTTFWTPFGRYRWKRMPFGIKSASEEFQRRLDECLEGLQNISVIADDIIVYGCGDSQAEAEANHDNAIESLLKRCRERGLKLNEKKMKFKLDQVTYMGHIFCKDGIKPDPEKVKAILEMPHPDNVTSVQRLIGMVTYLSKFLPQLSTICEPLRRLTDAKAVFDWLPQHETAFQSIKSLVTQAPVLHYYDASKPVALESDSSEVGLGAVITQDGHPIAYASRALTQTERNYAQIEKECLSIVFAAERFEQYILGKDKVKAYTDHKPLTTIFKKPILTSPKRLQRMRLRLQKYSLDIEYKPGPKMYISDTLSRASLPLEDKEKSDYMIYEFEEIDEVVFVTDERLHQIRMETQEDKSLQTLSNIVMQGWPNDKYDVPLCIREYWPYRDEITTMNGLLYRGTRIIIPIVMRPAMTTRAHASHMGIQYTVNTAKEIMFWPRMSSDLKEAVQKCSVCEDYKPAQQNEELMTHPIAKFPWQAVASDCFELEGKKHIVIVDLYSDYIEYAPLKDMSSKALIDVLRPIFANHGTPNTLWTDNGTNYVSQEFKDFAKSWEFEHCTSSPHHHQSNGKAESAVKIMKTMIKKARTDKSDIYKCLLEWRNSITPGLTSSPAQRLMSRRTRSFLPCGTKQYEPKVVTDVTKDIVMRRRKSKHYYDKKAKNLPQLVIGQPVRVKTAPQSPRSKWTQGQVVGQESARSYRVQVGDTTLRRNRIHVRDTLLSDQDKSKEDTVQKETAPPPTAKKYKDIPSPIIISDKPSESTAKTSHKAQEQEDTNASNMQSAITTTRSGRQIRAPSRYMQE